MRSVTYKDAGVDIDAGARAVALMRQAVEATHGPEVLAGLGAFGGLFDAARMKTMEHPVLVASTDGVGTKTRIAADMGRLDTIGEDLVAHCVNDVIAQGARPLFMLDYVATSDLDPERVAAIVNGVARACARVGCALIGGETAEMPGVYAPGQFDLVGTLVGVVERGAIIDGARIQAGDLAIGLASSGLHTNGFTLARHLIRNMDLHAPFDALYAKALGDNPPDQGEHARAPLPDQRPHDEAKGGPSLGELLLAPHRCYAADVDRMRAAGIDLRGLIHVTGGGLIENPPRILRGSLSMRLHRRRWPTPPIFRWLQRLGEIEEAEMARTFNLGLGMIALVPPAQAADAIRSATCPAWVVGEIVDDGLAGVDIVT